MYMQMVRCFVKAAEDQNVGGEMMEMRAAEYKLKKIITDKNEPNLSISFEKFCDNLKGSKPFFGRKNHRTLCKEKLIPMLVESKHIVFCAETKTIYINPRLRG